MKTKTYGKQTLIQKLFRKMYTKRDYVISEYFCRTYKQELVSKGFTK